MQVRANGQGVIGIDGAVAFLDVLNDAVLVDDDVGALGPFVGFVRGILLRVVGFQDPVFLEHFLVHVAEEGKLDANLLGEGRVGRGRINADAENFRVVQVDLAGVDSRLDRLELLRSTTGKGKHVDGKEYVLLAVKVAELDRFPLIAEEGEVRGFVAHLQGDLGHLFALLCRPREGRNERHSGEQHKGSNNTIHESLRTMGVVIQFNLQQRWQGYKDQMDWTE